MDNFKYTVYRHINKVSKKQYVGITCRPVKERWGFQGHGYKSNTCFYRAIKKYGWDNFEHKIIIHGLTKNQAIFWEQKLINHYRTTDKRFDYNLTTGGDCFTFTNEVKQNMSKIAKRNMTKEKRLHLSYKAKQLSEQRKLRIGKTNGFVGKHHNQKSKYYMCINNYSAKMKGKNHFNCSKCIRIKDEKIYNSYLECKEDNNCSSGTLRKHLSCNVEIPMFLYFEDYKNLTKQQQRQLKELQKIANLYSYKTKYVVKVCDGTVYSSLEQCAKDNYDSISCINKHCNKNPEGQKYMLLKDYKNLSLTQQEQLRENYLKKLKNFKNENLGGYKIRNNKTGIVYNSISQTCKKENIQKQELLEICEKKNINNKYMYLCDYELCTTSSLKQFFNWNIVLQTNNTRCKSVKDLRTGIVYSSIKECSKHVVESVPRIISQCKGTSLHKNFEYVF